MGIKRAVGVGADPAGKRDGFGLAVVMAERNNTSLRVTLLSVDKITGVPHEDQPEVPIQAALRLDRDLPASVALGICTDATGYGGSMSRHVYLGLQDRKRRRELRRHIMYKAMTLSGGNKVGRMKAEGSFSYEMSGSREYLIGLLHTALTSQSIDLTELSPEGLAILEREMKTFRDETTKSGRVKRTHATGAHDDALWALALAYWMALELVGAKDGGVRPMFDGGGVAAAFGLAAPKPRAEPTPARPRTGDRRAGRKRPKQPVGGSHFDGTAYLGTLDGRSADRITRALAGDAGAREESAGVSPRTRDGRVAPWRKAVEPTTDQRVQHGDDWWKYTPGGSSAV